MDISGSFNMRLLGKSRLFFRGSTRLLSSRGRTARAYTFHVGPFFVGATATDKDLTKP